MTYQNYFVYIATNPGRQTVLYIGLTNDLERRGNEHSARRGGGFSKQYNAHKIVHFEAYPDRESAIAREKQLKGWSRAKKELLIAKQNPEWRDLILEMHSTLPAAGGSR